VDDFKNVSCFTHKIHLDICRNMKPLT
jgi:hypothetical protein